MLCEYFKKLSFFLCILIVYTVNEYWNIYIARLNDQAFYAVCWNTAHNNNIGKQTELCKRLRQSFNIEWLKVEVSGKMSSKHKDARKRPNSFPYKTCIRPVLECTSPVCHYSLPARVFLMKFNVEIILFARRQSDRTFIQI